MTAPAAGGPEGKKDEPRKADAGHAAPTAAKDNWFARGAEAVVKAPGKLVMGILRFTRESIRRVLVAGGALVGVDLTKESQILERVKKVRAGVEKVVGSTTGFVAGLPMRLGVEHPLRALRILWSGKAESGGGQDIPHGATPAAA